MSENKKSQKIIDEPLKPIPLDQRQHWLTPAMIFGGLEFCVPVIMIGAVMVGSFSVKEVLLVTLLGMLLFTWPGNAIAGYVGSKSGLSSSVIARMSFGEKQSRFLISSMLAIVVLGHWGMQTAVAGNAICATFGIDYIANRGAWALVTIVIGILFAIPAVLGYESMKWTDYVAVPGGLLLCVFGIYLSLKNIGIANIFSFRPENPSMTILSGIGLIVSLNSAQLMLAMDYTRFVKPTWKENFKVPIGIIGVGAPLIFVGSLMAVGHGNADIVAVMNDLGFPVWGFLVLWLSTWTSQIVNNYSAGLSLANAFNVDSDKGRKLVTFIAAIAAIGLSLVGILERFVDLYSVTGLFFPAMAGVIFTDFFIRGEKFEETTDWNWVATIAMVFGAAVGYFTNYIIPFGIPAVQSLIVSVVVYYLGMKSKIVAAESKTKSVVNE